jgi:predicted dehydrogenase
MKKKQRAILAGCGAMSREWLNALRNYADQVELVGLVDLREEAASHRAKEFELGGVWTGPSLDEALKATRPDIVFNCTVPEAHVATCTLALNADCHVLVEKPLSPTVAEGISLARLSHEKGRTLAVIQNRRYLPGAIAVRDCLESGMIGPVTSVSADFFIGPRFGGFRESMPHVLLLDMAIHTFDQCRQMLGRNAERVTCHEYNPAGSWFAHGASAMALFEMEGGIPFSYRGSWCARGFNTAWAGSWRITGETGSLLWDGESKIVVERVDGTWDGKSFMEPVERLEIPLASLEARELGHAGNIGEFLRAIETGIPPQTAANDNLHSLAMVEGAIESARRAASVILTERSQ